MRENPITYFEDLHPLAEFSGKEEKTARYIADQLKMMGVEFEENVGGTGLVGYIRGEQSGPVVLFRADMDALPYADANGGLIAIHACGHDAHCAMLLAAVPKLKDIVRRGVLKLVFQSGEEDLTGALALIEEGVGEDVDVAIAAHIRPIQDLEPGEICPKVWHVACATIVVTIEGCVAHASRPHLGINSVDAAASMIGAINSMRLMPNESWSIKATRIQSEPGASNSLAAWTKVTLDLRAQSNELLCEMMEKLEAIVHGTASAYQTKASIALIEECPASDYDPALVETVEKAIVEVVGKEKLGSSCGGGGEDFHFFKTKKPSIRTAYFGVGVGATPGLHHREMTFDTQYLQNGTAMWHVLARELLG